MDEESRTYLTECIGRLEDEAARARAAATTLRTLLDTATAFDPDHIRAMARAVMDQVRHLPHPAGGAGLTQSEAAARVLREAGCPLPTGEIVAEIVRRGLCRVQADRKQFVNSLFSAMAKKATRGDTFRKVASGIWGLVE